ncbi:MAG: single-stranded-DNA-specific exonuclease RecJ [Granulosicoccaceae bacterium]|jgi:single-stranded-DNA-specific exonuclease
MSPQNQKQVVQRSLKVPLLAGIPDLLARIYAARDVQHSDELQRGLAALPDYRSLSGIATAVELLCQARDEQQRVLIVADFDADGATSCALMMRGLKLFGFERVDYLVPNRFEYGYGLTPEIVALAAQRQPQLLITVDNGISSHAGVAAAREAGMQVLVTDHHLPAETLPCADAIVNPNQPGDQFPGKNIAGVGVAFYLLLALRAHLREMRGEQGPNLAQLLDLVALGTVADVVPLDVVNRVLVAQGIARIRAGECVPGIQALLEIAGRRSQRLVASDLGFAVGPRLNAAGRLEDMSLGIECLLTDDMQAARAMAQRLDELNQARRDIEQDMQQQALAIVEALHLDDEQAMPFGLCLYEPDWHQGVIGILAGRIKDRLHRPVIAFARAGEGELKGSARSVPGLHIRDALDAVAARHPQLLSKFGGHAMAAGLSLAEENFTAFAEAFDDEVRRHLQQDDLQGVVHTDGELAAHELNLEVAELLREAGPWGQAFPEPVFEGEFTLIKRRIVGEKHLKLVVQGEGGQGSIDAIAFFQTDADWPDQVSCLRLVYRLDVNEYAGRRSPQLVVEHIEIID